MDVSVTYSYPCMSTKDDVGGRMLDSVLRRFSSMAQSRKVFHGSSFCFSHPGEVLILCWVSSPWRGYRQGHAPLTQASLPESPHSGQAACVWPQHRASGWMCQLGPSLSGCLGIMLPRPPGLARGRSHSGDEWCWCLEDWKVESWKRGLQPL